MINLYDALEIKFLHNRTVLEPYAATVSEKGNGDFSLALALPLEYATEIETGKIIKAPTPRGPQPFRIFSVQKTLSQLQVKARHITYDTACNFLEDVRPTGLNGQAALSHIENGRLYTSSVKLVSDIPVIGTAYYVRKTELEALMGADNSFLSVWGGYLIRDGWEMNFRQATLDHGYRIELGLNLTGVEATEDITNVATKVVPTFVLEDNQVHFLPEKFIISPISDRYPYDIVRELRVELTDKQRKQTAESLYPYIREQVAKAFDAGLDKPKLSYKISFVPLAKTEAYKDLGLLEELDIFDRVACHVPHLGIDVSLVMTEYTYDSIKEKFDTITIGESLPTGSSVTRRIQRSIEDQIVREDSPMMIKISSAQKELADSLTGVKGGNILTRRLPDGKPYEILAMDTDDIKTAKYVVRLSNKGIGISKNGVNGPFSVATDAERGIYADQIYGLKVTTAMLEAGAVTADKIRAYAVTTSKIDSGAITSSKIEAGAITTDKMSANSINGDRIQAGTLDVSKLRAFQITANQIKAGRLQSNLGGSYIDLDNGTAYFTGTVSGSNIQNSNMSAGGYGGAYAMDSSGSMSSRKQTAQEFAFQSGKISQGVQIGNYMYASGTGIYVNGNGYVCSFETMGDAWIAIHRGSGNERFNASNLIWGVGTNGTVYTSDLSTKKNVKRLDLELALDFIKDTSLWEFDRRQDDQHSVGVIANLVEKSPNPLAQLVTGKYTSPEGDSVRIANYGNLAILNMGALKALAVKVENLEQENKEFRSRLEKLDSLVSESEAK